MKVLRRTADRPIRVARHRRPLHAEQELEELVGEVKHLSGERRRARAEGSVRRHLERRLVDAEDRFERLLVRAVPDGRDQVGWRARFYRGAPAPRQSAAQPAPVYRGRAESGVAVEVIDTRDGDWDVVIGGEVVKRLESGHLAALIGPDGAFDLDGRAAKWGRKAIVADALSSDLQPSMEPFSSSRTSPTNGALSPTVATTATTA